MTRNDGRKADEMRPISIITHVQKDPAGSVQISFGNTVVLVAATIAEDIPPWLRQAEKEQGWITAEYAMLPGSTPGRAARRHKGRSEEIQRLVGRSLRAAADLEALGRRTITVDCDVIQADGGTRTAAITGGYIALELAMQKLIKEGKLERSAIIRPICAVSCVVVDDTVVLDPDYSEDHRADVDMNFVITENNEFIEVQGTAEGKPFSQDTLDQLIRLAHLGADQLFKIQQGNLS
jgi:ribonuclease PH